MLLLQSLDFYKDGRTGRRKSSRNVVCDAGVTSRVPCDAIEIIPWSLLQGIALIQLYLEEKWVEPPEPNRLPYSLLHHQTMSTLASSGK